MKTIIKSVLLFFIFLLSFLVWQSIQKPIRFNKEKEKRYRATIQRLKDIRTAQLAYFEVKGHFTGSFDSLLHFVKSDSIPIIKALGTVPDTLSEKEALKRSLIRRDTAYTKAIDSLFRPGYPIDSLPFVPFSGGKRFRMAATLLNAGSTVSDEPIKIPVFEASVLNRDLLKGLDNQLRINLDDEMIKFDKYPGLKVGSLVTNVNHQGSWE
jgi:hypothetical protein